METNVNNRNNLYNQENILLNQNKDVINITIFGIIACLLTVGYISGVISGIELGQNSLNTKKKWKQ